MSRNKGALAEVERVVDEVIYEATIPLSTRNGLHHYLVHKDVSRNLPQIVLEAADAAPNHDIKITITRIK